MKPPTPPSAAVLAQIQAAATDEFLDRLLHYAMRKASGLKWLGVMAGPMPCGEEPKDLVAEALKRVVEGRRKWNPSTHPDFLKYMMDTIDSLVSHLVEGDVNANEKHATPFRGESDEECFDRVRDPRFAPSKDGIVTAEEEIAHDAWFMALLDEVQDDPLLPRILECNMDGIWRREEVASALNVSPNDVTQAKKRLDRRLPKIREKLAHLHPHKSP